MFVFSVFFENTFTHLRGLVGSGVSFRLAAAFQNNDQFLLLVLDDAEQAAYFLNDFEQLLSENKVLYFPASYRQPYALETTDNANILMRAEVLNRLSSRRKPSCIVTYPDAIFEKVITKKELNKRRF